MQKKLNIIILLGLCFTLVGCGNNKIKGNDTKINDDTSETQKGSGICTVVNEERYNYKYDKKNPLKIGTEYICDPGTGQKSTFYVLEVKNDKLYLISDSNIGGRVMFSSDNETGKVKEAKEQLDRLTSDWTKVEVTMPTLEQIVNATNLGDIDKTEINLIKELNPIDHDNVDNNNYYNQYKYAWLSTNLSAVLEDDDTMFKYCLNSTSKSGETYFTYYVSADGYLSAGNIDDEYITGVRPVIVVKKTDLTY